MIFQKLGEFGWCTFGDSYGKNPMGFNIASKIIFGDVQHIILYLNERLN